MSRRTTVALLGGTALFLFGVNFSIALGHVADRLQHAAMLKPLEQVEHRVEHRIMREATPYHMELTLLKNRLQHLERRFEQRRRADADCRARYRHTPHWH